MAIRDVRTTFANDVSIAAAAGTALVGDVIDLSAQKFATTGDGLNEVDDINLIIEIGSVALITGGSAGTVQFTLVTADNAALSTNPVILYTSASIVTGASGNPVGTIYANVPLPYAPPLYKQFLGIKVITGTTTTTAGTIRAFLAKEGISLFKAFPAAATDGPLA